MIIPTPERISSRVRFCGAVIFACALASCGKESAEKKSEPADSSPVLARVAGDPITQADFEAEVQFRMNQRRPLPEKAALLNEMIERRALLYRARQGGLESDAGIRRELENLLIARLRQRELENELRAAKVSDDELQAAYEARIAEFTRPAKVRVAILRLKAGAKASEEKRAEVRARLEEARQKALATPAPGGRGPAAQGFGALAIDYTDDQTSRYRGGDIGWLNQGSFEYRWPRALLEAAYGGEKGVVSEVLEIDGDYYLAMKADFREAAVQPFADAKQVLRVGLLRTKREQLQDDFRQETMRIAKTTIDQSALAAVKLPAPVKPPANSPVTAKPPAVPSSANN